MQHAWDGWKMHVKLVLKLKKGKHAIAVTNKINLEGKECVQRALVATLCVS